MEENNKDKNINNNSQIFLYIIFFIFSSFLSLSYLFIFCFLYFSLFIFLQFLITFDATLNQSESINLFVFTLSFIKNFYFYFNIFSYILRFLIIPFYIGYLKSGYIKTWKKILDAIFHHYIILGIIIVIALLGLIAFYVFKKQMLNFYGRIDLAYLNYLNFLGLIRIYLNVGYFIPQLFIDCRKKLNKKLIKKYNNFLLKLLKDKSEKDLKKMENAYNKLNEEVIKSNIKNINLEYYSAIKLLLDQSKSQSEMYNIDFYIENFTYNGSIEFEENRKESDNNEIKFDKMEKIKPKKDINKIENELAPFIKTLKNKMRNIIKLKYLIKNIKDKTNKYLNKTFCVIFKSILKNIVFFYALIYICFLDLIFPIIIFNKQKSESNNNSIKNSKYKRRLEDNNNIEFNLITNIYFFLLIILFTIINSPYSIAIIYTINKRRFISGNYLYGKNICDNLDLIGTIKANAGLAFPLSYCNIYLYCNLSLYDKRFKNPIFYEIVKIPDYNISGLINLLSLIKFGLFIFFAIISQRFEKILFFKINDLANFNKEDDKDNSINDYQIIKEEN